MIDYIKKIEDVLKENNITPASDIFEKLEKYYCYLTEYNKSVNLTAITEKQDVFVKHFADSMLGVKNYKHGATVCDIGTGAGFPGVILKIVRPDLKITLVDSLNKRIVFLNQLINLLKLDNITALHYRADSEDFKKKYLNSFDYVIARAVASMNTLTEYCLPFVKVDGYFIAYKSDNNESEIDLAKNCINLLGGSVDDKKYYMLNDETRRCLIFVRKNKVCSSKYPRSQNKPRLSPL